PHPSPPPQAGEGAKGSSLASCFPPPAPHLLLPISCSPSPAFHLLLPISCPPSPAPHLLLPAACPAVPASRLLLPPPPAGEGWGGGHRRRDPETAKGRPKAAFHAHHWTARISR